MWSLRRSAAVAQEPTAAGGRQPRTGPVQRVRHGSEGCSPPGSPLVRRQPPPLFRYLLSPPNAKIPVGSRDHLEKPRVVYAHGVPPLGNARVRVAIDLPWSAEYCEHRTPLEP